MAILDGGLLGKSKGKVGNIVTGSDVKKQVTARAYQPNVANPRTTAQLLSRVIIAGASKLTGSFLAATGGKTYKVVPENYPQARSYMVATMRKNTTDTVEADNGVGFANTDQIPNQAAFATMPIRWANGQLTNGNISCTGTSAINTPDIEIELTWTPANVGGYDSATDKLTILMIDTRTGGVQINNLSNPRSTATAAITLTIPPSMENHYVVITAFFRKEVGSNLYDNVSPGFTLLTGTAADGETLSIQNITGNQEIFG